MHQPPKTYIAMTTNLRVLKPEQVKLMDADTFARYKLHLVIGESLVRASEIDYWNQQVASMRGDM